jgi:tripartite-type tricarboxylate transporter receptor subunit TctC
MTHLAGELFKQLTGTPAIVHIPYKGAGPGIADLVSGHIPMMTPNITGQLLDLHRTGKVRILAVNAPVRMNGAPDIPTAIEGGIPGMVVQVFNGLFTPAKTSSLIVDRIAQSTHVALADKEFQAALIKSGFEPAIDPSPEAAKRLINEEHARLTPLVKSLGFTIN